MDGSVQRTLPEKYSGVHVLNVSKMRNVSSFEDMQYIKLHKTTSNKSKYFTAEMKKRKNQNVVENAHCNTVYLSELFLLKLFRKELPCLK